MIWFIEGEKSRRYVIAEFDLNASTLDRWISEYHKPTNTSNPEIYLTNGPKRIAELEVQNKQLLMEVDILKHAALIIGRKLK